MPKQSHPLIGLIVQLTKLEILMSTQTDALKVLVNSIVAQINTAIAQEGLLKSRLDACIANGTALTAQVATLTADIASLQTQLAAAQAGGATSAADTQAVVDATATLQAIAQPLADANAVNNPAN